MKLYTIILFTPLPTGGHVAIKYRNINRIDKFINFAGNKYPTWTAANIYDKESKKFIKQLRACQ